MGNNTNSITDNFIMIFRFIFSLLIIAPIYSLGQSRRLPTTEPIKIEVTKNPTLTESFNQGLQNGLAIRSTDAAEANAQSNALKNNYEKIDIDLIKKLSNKYKYIAISRISGWNIFDNYEIIINEIKNANRYIIINEIGKISGKYSIEKQRIYTPPLPENYKNDSTTLFLEWHREAISDYDRVTRLILKNKDGVVLYQAEYKNKGFTEILRPIVSEYKMTAEDAKADLIKLKEYLNLGIINQKDYDLKSAELKTILLNF